MGEHEEGVAPGRDDGVSSLHQELVEHSATCKSPAKFKGGSDEEPAGAPGLSSLPLAFSSSGRGWLLLLLRRKPRQRFRQQPRNRGKYRGLSRGAATRRAASSRASHPAE